VKPSGKLKIIVVTGSSGGHIFPALSFLEKLKAKEGDRVETLLILPNKEINPSLIPQGINVRYIDVFYFKEKLRLDSYTFACLAGLFKGFLKSFSIISSFRPDVVVGFGSLASVPVVLIAWFLRIKTMIHEQNVLCGKANKLLSVFADKIAISFPETKRYLGNKAGRAIVTGNPIRSDLKVVSAKEAREFLGLEKDKFTVLVMGGSQGSRNINFAFLEALSGLPDNNQLQVIHLTGTQDYPAISQGYQGLGVKAKTIVFLNKMQYAYSAADLAVCRAGAITIAELVFFGLPAILIPYPFVYKHQFFNARTLESRQAAIILDDNQFLTNRLRTTMDILLKDRPKIGSMQQAYADIKSRDASLAMVEELRGLII